MSKFGYMCGVDFQHEVGEGMHAIPIYSSLENIKKHCVCWGQCGIVKVKFEIVKWLEPQDFTVGVNKESDNE